MPADTLIPGQASLLCSMPHELFERIIRQLTGKDHASLARSCQFLLFTLQGPLFCRFSIGYDYYPITYGIQYRNNAIIRRALAYRQPNSLYVSVNSSSTVLGLASHLGHTPQVSYLIHRGADVNFLSVMTACRLCRMP